MLVGPRVDSTLNVPWELQPFSNWPKGVMTLVDVEMKLNIASFAHRHSPP